MHAYVYQDGADSELADIGDTLELPCDLDTALELWTGYRDHGILARAGGYLDQPRWWRNLMRLISSRHSPISDQHRAEQATDDSKPERGHGGEAWAHGDIPIADGWDALNTGS